MSSSPETAKETSETLYLKEPKALLCALYVGHVVFVATHVITFIFHHRWLPRSVERLRN